MANSLGEHDERETSHREHDSKVLKNQVSRAGGRQQSSSFPPQAQSLRKHITGQKRKRPIMDEEEIWRKGPLLSSFSEEQLSGFEIHCQSAFCRRCIKGLMQFVTGNFVSENVAITMAAMATVFVRGVVEALNMHKAWDKKALLYTKHLRKALRRLKLKGENPFYKA
ncbi:TATA-box binding protein associated factor 11 like protein 2-like [Psammomys obesus]|uniref:TATA-box binding protein associated factor 11 like protein 2-like n=1 Tax=Psammomys obesus TaxID=48139 RepID=UPI002452E585|nr:TATA-box binding protein associated factor 11 like protein 2-like [Psammomys obesus]